MKEEPMREGEVHGKERKGIHFWRVFWLSFLVLSLGYAGYCFYAPSNKIVWAEDLSAAKDQAAEEGRPMILFFTGEWCSPCRIMKRQVWADEEVEALVNENYTLLMVDVDAPESGEIMSRYPIGATPTTIITDSEGKVLKQVGGGISKEEFLALLPKERLGID